MPRAAMKSLPLQSVKTQWTWLQRTCLDSELVLWAGGWRGDLLGFLLTEALLLLPSCAKGSALFWNPVRQVPSAQWHRCDVNISDSHLASFVTPCLDVQRRAVISGISAMFVSFFIIGIVKHLNLTHNSKPVDCEGLLLISNDSVVWKYKNVVLKLEFQVTLTFSF